MFCGFFCAQFLPTEKISKKELTGSACFALMGSLFKFKRAASKEAASKKEESKFFGSQKKLFLKKMKIFEKNIDNRKRNRLNGQPFQIQTSGFGRGGE